MSISGPSECKCPGNDGAHISTNHAGLSSQGSCPLCESTWPKRHKSPAIISPSDFSRVCFSLLHLRLLEQGRGLPSPRHSQWLPFLLCLGLFSSSSLKPEAPGSWKTCLMHQTLPVHWVLLGERTFEILLSFCCNIPSLRQLMLQSLDA